MLCVPTLTFPHFPAIPPFTLAASLSFTIKLSYIIYTGVVGISICLNSPLNAFRSHLCYIDVYAYDMFPQFFVFLVISSTAKYPACSIYELSYIFLSFSITPLT